MRVIDNYSKQVVEADKRKNTWSKRDLIYLIRKYLIQDDGSIPKTTKLNKMTTVMLHHIWIDTKPERMFTSLN